MKMFIFRVGLLFAVVALAACSKSKPSSTLLDQAIQKELPAHLAVSGKEYQYSPIKEVLGTTLPEGSYQVDVKTTVRTKEPLYVRTSSSHGSEDAIFSTALRAEFQALKPLEEWCDRNTYVRPAGSPILSSFLAQAAEAKDQKEVWVKVIAEPRGSEWMMHVVEGEPAAAFSKALPRSAFDSRILVYGSEEQKKNVAAVKASYEEAQRREAIIKRLEPRIAELRAEEELLATKYEKESSAKVAQAIQEARAASRQHGERVDEMMRAGNVARDNYKTRDQLIRQEGQRYEAERNLLDAKVKELTAIMDSSSKRAKSEIDAKIKALEKQEGLNPELAGR